MVKIKRKAFTLTEILVALSIIVVLISFSVYGVNIAKRQGRELERIKVVANIKAAVETMGSTYGSYPSNSQIHYINSGKFQVCNETGAKCKDISISSQDFLSPLEKNQNGAIISTPLSTSTTTVYCYNYYPQDGKYVLGFKSESGMWKEYGNHNTMNCGNLNVRELSNSFITHLDVEQATIAPSLTAKPPSQTVYQATDPNPADGATNVFFIPTLSWTAGKGAKEHEVYFGITNPPIKIMTQANTTYTPGTLLPSTKYYWRITEKSGSAKATGNIWSFTTGQNMTPAVNPTPANGFRGVNTYPTLGWTAGTGAITSYDVYFGTTNPPPLVTNQTQNTYKPTRSLVTNTQYYWRIDEKGNQGTLQGTLWSFTTTPYICRGNALYDPKSSYSKTCPVGRNVCQSGGGCAYGECVPITNAKAGTSCGKGRTCNASGMCV